MKTLILLTMFLALTLTSRASVVLQEYERPGELAPLPPGEASLYRVPWRSRPRTVSAQDALQGVGVYYKHIAANENVMKQLAAAGVRRLRLAPHFTMYIHKDWTGPKPEELANLLGEFKGCRAAGIRPCVVFVHIPIMGNNVEAQNWVRTTWKKELMDWGAPGSDAWRAYWDKTWLGLKSVLDAARAAGFTEPDSYDIEMGQNIWWGFPALPPCPSLTPAMLRQGGMVYEFDKALVDRARQEGYREPLLWNSQSYHYFEQMTADEMIPGEAGRAVSIYSPVGGVTDTAFTGRDAWPDRAPLRFAEGLPPVVTLAKPESWAADFSRRDNLLALLDRVHHPVAITSLGIVPSDIPGAMLDQTNTAGQVTKVKAPGADGWLWKSKGLTRSLAFWLNQGASFVLLHSAYEGGNDEMSHALIPDQGQNLDTFQWPQSRPLTVLHAWVNALGDAKPVAGPLLAPRFRFAIEPDPILIAGTGNGQPLRASDAIALLPFQLDAKRLAVAAYIVTPDITKPLPTLKLTLQVDQALRAVTARRPLEPARQQAKIRNRDRHGTTLTGEITDDVTWYVMDLR